MFINEDSTRLHDPFGAKPHKYFVTPELSQRLNLIRHLIANSEQLILTLADTGGGKTTLLYQLRKAAAKHHEYWWVYTLNSTPALSTDVFISTLLSSFNVRQDGKPSQILQESLRNHIASTRYNGQLPVLLVDDAHLLPLATLKLIVELAMQGEPLTRMRVILFCEPQITSILATPEFEIVHNTLTHTLDIPAFSKIQTRDYIQCRLDGTKYSTIHPFNSDTLKKIYNESEGIPGEINLLAQEILKKFAEQRRDFLLASSLSHPKLMWGINLLILLIGLGLLLYWQNPQWFTKSTTPPLLSVTPTPAAPTLPSPWRSDQPLTASTLPPASLPIAAVEDTTSVLPIPALKSSPTSALAQAAGLSTTATPATATDLVAADWLGQSKIKNEQWLQRQNSNAYTLQLLGAYDALTIRKFLNQYSLNSDELAMFKTIYNGKEWLVLVYGVYSNRTQALAALQTLPDSLQKTSPPWIRKLENIQKDIQNGKL